MLETLLGSRNVYFQPPPSIHMNYPAIVYELSGIRNVEADNLHYNQHKAYQLTVIDEDPDSEISDAVAQLEMCSFNRSFASDDLNHFVYTLYY